MLEKQIPSDQQIIDCLKSHYNIQVVALTFLPLGADMNASVYKADTQYQSSYFVKLKHGHHHDISIDILELLSNSGIQQIILPIKTTMAQSIQFINDFSIIVYPFVEGQNSFSRPLTDNQWLILGNTLKKIHEIDVPLSIQHRLRRETYSPIWRETVRSLYQQLNAEPSSDKIADKLLAFMKKNIGVIHSLVDCAEHLAQNLQNASPKFVLCHSDLHAGNVLISDNTSIYIVDWDEPIMAPKERDLMFIGGGVGHVWNKQYQEALFYKGYGNVEINRSILTYYRNERIVEDIALFALKLLLSSSVGANRAEMYKHFLEMFEPNGVVDIAFKADEK